ncbi:MAG: type 4a pilus biogenesis protein PilO [candidate division NC10 bacterium]|nr:type 4a pilus biogenesis protein PilO [candidate division NC10 bacterium]
MGISKREILILAVLAVAALAVYFVVLIPTTQELTQLTAEAERLSGELQKIQKATSILPQGKEGLEETRKRMEEIRARLLPPGGLSSLFGEISRPSKRLGVRIISFTPKGADPAKHGQVLADLVLEAKYLDLGKFLEELLASQYLLTVSDLKLSAAKVGDPLLRMTVTLKTWMRQEGSG